MALKHDNILRKKEGKKPMLKSYKYRVEINDSDLIRATEGKLDETQFANSPYSWRTWRKVESAEDFWNVWMRNSTKVDPYEVWILNEEGELQHIFVVGEENLEPRNGEGDIEQP